MNLKQQLQNGIHSSDWSLRRWSRETGVPLKSLQRFLQEDANIALSSVEAIADALGLDFMYSEDIAMLKAMARKKGNKPGD